MPHFGTKKKKRSQKGITTVGKSKSYNSLISVADPQICMYRLLIGLWNSFSAKVMGLAL